MIEPDASKPSRLRMVVLWVLSMSIALGLAFALGEIAVRVAASRVLIYNIEMVRYATQLKMPDPTGEVSHVHRPNASAKLMGVDITLNSLGHRSKELTPTRSPNLKRVFVLGSSVTMGWGVPAEKVFTSWAEDRINNQHVLGKDVKVEFANAGIGNYNTRAQHKLFKDQYARIKPDAVVLHYFISDAEPRPPGRNSIILRYSYFAAYVYDRVRMVGLRASGKTDLFKYYSDIYKDENPYWKETLGLVADMQKTAAADKVPFMIMIVPDFHNLGKDSPYATIYAKIEAGFKALGIHTTNAFPVFQQRYGGHESDLWIQPDDPHPNAKGHELMGELLVNDLRDAF